MKSNYILEAIAAMREPTEAMLHAGNPDGHYGIAKATWQAMIDEALK